MIIAKFGGSSLATSDAISKVREICASVFSDSKGIVVVSAVGGVTDKLRDCGIDASSGNENYLKELKAIEDRHIKICKELFPASKQSAILTKIKLHLNRLEDVYRGVYLIGELTTKTRDYILSFGERMSSSIVYEYFKLKIKGVSLLDPTSFISTDDNFGNANVDFSITERKIRKVAKDIEGLAVCPGFIAGSKSGTLTTLGRGGSDYTASILAGALKAKVLEIWTDVSGMMTADPRYVSSAHPIENISYEEALELSHFGAKVIYPPYHPARTCKKRPYSD